MSKVAIVAIPRQDDPVWKYSSEKVPHLTLLVLGEQTKELDIQQMAEFLQHTAATTMFPFYMSVDHRGLLGSDNADVLFFDKDKHGKSMPNKARHHLLTNTAIRNAYDSITQYPEWTPHLTMGYPKTPAKKDDRSDPTFWGVEFDRVALWTGEYTGPEFRLEARDLGESDMTMADKTEEFLASYTTTKTERYLAHYGVKGMRWGRSKAGSKAGSISDTIKRVKTKMTVPDGEVEVNQRRPGTKVQTKGGKKVEADDDAIKAAVSKQIAKKSTTDALSTKDLQDLVTRMNLEVQFQKLSVQQVSPGRKFVNDLISKQVKGVATNYANDQAQNFVNEAVNRKK